MGVFLLFIIQTHYYLYIFFERLCVFPFVVASGTKMTNFSSKDPSVDVLRVQITRIKCGFMIDHWQAV